MSILAPTDFSDIASQAADVAAAIAKKRGIPLRLIHSMSPWIGASELPVTATLDDMAVQQLEAEAARLRARGAEVATTFRHGRPDGEVAAATGEEPVELIVIGSGDPAAGHRLAGSVAGRVAEGVAVPTLVVRRPGPLRVWLGQGAPLRVLCAMDFSVSSDAALTALGRLSDLGTLHLEFVHFARPGEADVTTTGAIPPGQLTGLQRDLWQRAHDVLGDVFMSVHVVPDDGHAAEALTRLAATVQADLLVVGARQIHGLRRLLAPSFSRGVLARASANVLCVPLAAGAPESVGVPRLRRMVVALDFSPGDARTLSRARGLAAGVEAMHLLHVCPAPSPVLNPALAAEMYLDNGDHARQARQAADERLQALIQEELPDLAGAVTSEAVIHGDVAAAICDAAERLGADVICMGSHGHSRVGAALLGSVAQSVIARAHRPVLVVPPPRS
jgi:nucleotide-binding universal stress UspA family protein